MSDEVKEVEQASQPVQQKAKPKNEKITLILTGAGSCTIEDFTLRKGQFITVDSAKVEKFLATGLFVKA